MLIVDASVAVKFITEEPDSDLALELLQSPEPLGAPSWLLAECANALIRKVLKQSLPPAAAREANDNLLLFFSKVFPTEGLLPAALDLSLRLEHAFYDCIYLALALQENRRMITADRKFVNAAECAGLRSCVVLLGERI